MHISTRQSSRSQSLLALQSHTEASASYSGGEPKHSIKLSCMGAGQFFNIQPLTTAELHGCPKSTGLSIDRIGSISNVACQVTSPQSHINPPNRLGGCSDHGLYSSAGTSLASERLVQNLVIHWERRKKNTLSRSHLAFPSAALSFLRV